MTQGPDELSEVISQALLNAQDRDALSGWGGVVKIMYVGWQCVVGCWGLYVCWVCLVRCGVCVLVICGCMAVE